MSINTTCPGCGRSFRGERGLRSHQTARFVAMACRPMVPADVAARVAARLAAADAEIAAAADTERAEQIADVRRFYGDHAAELVADGWTVDGAVAHVTGSCDIAVCTADHAEPVDVETRTECICAAVYLNSAIHENGCPA